MNLTKKIIPLAAVFAVVLPAQAFAAPKPKLNFSQSAYAVAEDNAAGVATITVFRKGNTKRVSQAATVDYSTSDGTARNGVDYTASSGTLNFASGQTSASFTVPIINNTTVDGARTVKLRLSHPTASGGRAMLGFPSTATLVIADDDGGATAGPTFQTAVASDVVSESATSEPVYIVRSGDLGSPASVNYATASGTALDGTDYTGVSGTASFTAGSDESAILQQVNVPILHNPATDPATRDFSFNLSIGSAGSLGSPSSETVTIVNADGTPTLQFSSPTYDVAEKDGSARLTVIASGAITGTNEVDVDYATADGSAVAGKNYTSSSDTLQFFAGDVAASFDIPVLSDGQPGDKSFTAALSNPTGTGALGSPSSATITIHDSDTGSAGNPGGSGGSTNPQNTGTIEVLGSRQAACGLKISAAKKQKLLKKKVLTLKLSAPQRCKVALTTKIKQLRSKSQKRQVQIVRALQFNGKKASLTLQPGKAKTVKVKFTKKTLKAIKKALRARKNLVATVVVTSKDSASKVTRKTLKITIRR